MEQWNIGILQEWKKTKPLTTHALRLAIFLDGN